MQIGKREATPKRHVCVRARAAAAAAHQIYCRTYITALLKRNYCLKTTVTNDALLAFKNTMTHERIKYGIRFTLAAVSLTSMDLILFTLDVCF